MARFICNVFFVAVLSFAGFLCHSADAAEIVSASLRMVVDADDHIISFDVRPFPGEFTRGMPDLRITVRRVKGCKKAISYEEDVGKAQPMGIYKVLTDARKHLFVITLLSVSSFNIRVYEFRETKFVRVLDTLSKSEPMYTRSSDGSLVLILDDPDLDRINIKVTGNELIWNGSNFKETKNIDRIP